MTNKITYTPTFAKYAKKYRKKYRSLPDDLALLESELLKNPTKGISLGDGLYKIRLAVKSKNRGKSAGFRVITYYLNEDSNEIKLVIIYDKSEIGDISKEDLKLYL